MDVKNVSTLSRMLRMFSHDRRFVSRLLLSESRLDVQRLNNYHFELVESNRLDELYLVVIIT